MLAAVVRPGRATLAALAVTAAGAMLARATGGHAGSTWMVLAQWLHFMGVGAWIGGLAWLFLGLLRRLEPARVRRFSTVAGVALAVVVVGPAPIVERARSGVVAPPVPGRLQHDPRLKVAIVIALIGLGAVNRYRNVARYGSVGSRPMLWTVGGELALAAAVLLATGILTGLPPEPDEEPAGPGARPLVVGADFATTTKVRLEISPGTVGPNTFVATSRTTTAASRSTRGGSRSRSTYPISPTWARRCGSSAGTGRGGGGDGARAGRHLERDRARRGSGARSRSRSR